jgi:hypothetical protein
LRVELFMLVLAGAAGGMAGTLWSGIVTVPAWVRWPAARPAQWTVETAGRLLAGAAVYALGGAAGGLLFWLGWGLVAMDSHPWWRPGLAFGGLLWATTALPLGGVLALRLRQPPALLLLLGLESLAGCLGTGLACAYAWHQA